MTMTLTIRNISEKEFCRKRVDELRRYFAKLIHRKFFKRAVKGGFYFIQVTNKGQGWHLHLHVIFNGLYIPKGFLVKAWYEITGGSYIVDIGFARTPAQAVKYLLSDFQGRKGRVAIRDEDREIYNRVFKGRRLVQGFGEYAKVKIKKKGICPKCGCDSWLTEWDLRRLFLFGDLGAPALSSMLARASPEEPSLGFMGV